MTPDILYLDGVTHGKYDGRSVRFKKTLGTARKRKGESMPHAMIDVIGSRAVRNAVVLISLLMFLAVEDVPVRYLWGVGGVLLPVLFFDVVNHYYSHKCLLTAKWRTGKEALTESKIAT